MMRMFAPVILLVIFIGWILYRWIIKKDLRKHLTSLYVGLFFMGIWGLLYFLILR